MHRLPWRLLCALLVALPLPARGQDARAIDIPATRQHDFRSAITGRSYRLFVALPERYAADDTTRYPVLYLLDGNVFFRVATEEQRMLRFVGDVRDVIIVGIGYDVPGIRETQAPRWPDLTPSRDSAADAGFARRVPGWPPSGGAPAFLRVLADEIIPFVDARFRTTSDRGLWGHSLGGLFALYTLLERPALFTRYGISSPTLGWNGRELVAREAAFARTHRALPAHVFLSIGGDEGPDALNAFASTLGGRGYEGLDLASHVFEGETHASVVPAAFSRSIRFLYRAPARQ